MLSTYLTSLRSINPTTPVIIDENSALSCLSQYFDMEFSTFDACYTGETNNLLLYAIPEGKQHFDIPTVRRCIADMSYRPYESKTIAILRDFDTATLEAQNAMLKLLEDCPGYAAIMLIVSDPEALIETIRSRTISLYKRESSFYLTEDVRIGMDRFFAGEKEDFIRYLFGATYQKEEAISILSYAIRRGERTQLAQYEQALLDLFSTNENPRNILDSVFLIPGQV